MSVTALERAYQKGTVTSIRVTSHHVRFMFEADPLDGDQTSPQIIVSLLGPQNIRKLDQDFEITKEKWAPLRNSRRVQGKKVDMGLVAYLASDGTRSITQVSKIALIGINERHLPEVLVYGEPEAKEAFPILAAVIDLRKGSVEMVSKPLGSEDYLEPMELTHIQKETIKSHLAAYSPNNLADPSEWKGKGLLGSLILGNTPVKYIVPNKEDKEDSQMYWNDAGYVEFSPSLLGLHDQEMDLLGPSSASGYLKQYHEADHKEEESFWDIIDYGAGTE